MLVNKNNEALRENTISAALATYNEQANIEECIKSLQKFATEIVVADGNSTDKTAQIASSLGAIVILTNNKPMFHINKNLAINNCHGDWIFLIDADERVSNELAEEIKKIVKDNPEENGFWVPRRNWFLGGFLTKGGAYPDSVIRLFRNKKGHLPELSVHEQVKIAGKVGVLKTDILHLADPGFDRYLMRANRYTEQTADEIKRKKPKNNLTSFVKYTVFLPTFTFLRIFFRHRGYKDGLRGFVWALFSAAHHFYAYVKYWEKEKAQ